MKRSSFLKSLAAVIAAPLIVKASEGKAIFSADKLNFIERIKAWCTEHGKTPQQTKLFVFWYLRTLDYWTNELKTHGNTFFMNKDRVRLLERFEGQTCQNLWDQFAQQHPTC